MLTQNHTTTQVEFLLINSAAHYKQLNLLNILEYCNKISKKYMANARLLLKQSQNIQIYIIKYKKQAYKIYLPDNTFLQEIQSLYITIQHHNANYMYIYQELAKLTLQELMFEISPCKCGRDKFCINSYKSDLYIINIEKSNSAIKKLLIKYIPEITKLQRNINKKDKELKIQYINNN